MVIDSHRSEASYLPVFCLAFNDSNCSLVGSRCVISLLTHSVGFMNCSFAKLDVIVVDEVVPTMAFVVACL